MKEPITKNLNIHITEFKPDLIFIPPAIYFSEILTLIKDFF